MRSKPDISRVKAAAGRYFWRVFGIVFWIGVWWAASAWIDSEIILPTPWRTVARVAELASHLNFWGTVAVSVCRIGAGFVCGVAAGLVLGYICANVKPLHSLFLPLLTVVKSTPVASFILLAYVWIAKRAMPGFIAFLMVLPVVWTAVEQGVLVAPVKQKEVAEIYRFSFVKKLKYIYFPSLLPYFTQSVFTCAGLAWKAGIAAEVLVYARDSIGGELYKAKLGLETVDVFAWTLTVIVISLILERVIKLLAGTAKNRRK